MAICLIFMLTESNWSQFGPGSQHHHPTSICLLCIGEVYFAFFSVRCPLWMTWFMLIESSDLSHLQTYKFSELLKLGRKQSALNGHYLRAMDLQNGCQEGHYITELSVPLLYTMLNHPGSGSTKNRIGLLNNSWRKAVRQRQHISAYDILLVCQDIWKSVLALCLPVALVATIQEHNQSVRKHRKL